MKSVKELAEEIAADAALAKEEEKRARDKARAEALENQNQINNRHQQMSRIIPLIKDAFSEVVVVLCQGKNSARLRTESELNRDTAMIQDRPARELSTIIFETADPKTKRLRQSWIHLYSAPSSDKKSDHTSLYVVARKDASRPEVIHAEEIVPDADVTKERVETLIASAMAAVKSA